jgi:hypothetical protein
MKNPMLYLAMGAALCAAQAASALSNDFMIKGTSCVSTTLGNNGGHTQYGITNSSTTAMTVTCPLPMPTKNYLAGSLQVRGYNRNSAADPVSCTLLSTDQNGDFPASAVANVPYHLSLPFTGSAWLNPVVANGFLSLSCRIPGAVGGVKSYLTSILVTANY